MSNDSKDKLVVVEVRNEDEILADSHDNVLPTRKLIIVFTGMALALFLSFVDQTGITIALPYIAEELDTANTISWAGSSSLIGTTVFMVLFGRFSDIFSRKYTLVASMLVLAFFDLGCAFAQTPYQLYICRGFCGIGNGGITSLTMVIVSDVVSLENRGKYQGILGASVGLGNGIGPFLASAFISNHSWRGFYYLLCPTILLATIIIFWLVPYTKPDISVKEKLFKIDWLGFFYSSVGIIFLLIPVCGGGTSYEWASPFSISMITIGGCSLIAFIFTEWKFASLPMIPLHLFCTSASLTILLSQNFFFGMCYFGSIYYYPYYFQIVRSQSVTKTSLFLLCLVIPQSATSVISGQVISRTKHYIYVIWFGFFMWTLAMCLLNLWKTNNNFGINIITLVLNGCGVGAIFQPTLVSAQAHSYKKDRATVISTRNVLRSFGGSVGLTVSATIISNCFLKKLSHDGLNYFTVEEIAVLKKQIFMSINFDEYSLIQSVYLKGAYMDSLKNVFYFWIGAISYCLVSALPIKDHGLTPID